jgi:hypothetical protein
MKLKKIKKWTLHISLILIIAVIVSVIFANCALKQMYGGNTEVVDTDSFDVLAQPTVIINTNVLSLNGSYFIKNQTVWLDKGKIISIDTTTQFFKNHLIINGKGKYLIPGLIDSHMHLWQSPNDLLLYLVNGVTHVREMMGSSKHLKWRQEIEDEKRLGPKMFVASNKVQSFGLFEGWFMNWTQGNINLYKTKNALSTLKLLSKEGYDAVKLGSFLNKENYKAVSSATDKVDIPLIGHLPFSIGLNGLWNSNQKEVAHIEEIVKALRIEFGRVTIENRNEFLLFIQKQGEKVSDSLLKKDIAVGSTLWLSESFIKQKTELKGLLSQIQLSHVNPGVLEGSILTSRALGWIPEKNPYRLPKNISSDKLLIEKNYWTAYAEAHQILVKIFAKKGVKVLAGTDANLPIVVPGYSLHDELESLTQAGMTNSQALLSATAVPSDWVKIKSGKISPDFRADLILLNKNPLDNIENTKTIETVILNGKVFDRNQLDIILNAVKEANNRSRNKEIHSYIN